MRVFVTGASGWIGSAVVAELLHSGHEVLGLARSDSSAEKVAALGAEVARGSLDDLDSLRAGAAASDGVVHLGYNHDFSHMADAARTDAAAIDALGTALEGAGGPLVVASGTLGLAPGRVGTERDVPDAGVHPRVANAVAALAFAERGVRASIVRFAPTVHGPGDHGFIAVLVAIAREKGVSGYVDQGANRWPAVHRLDAGALVRRTVEEAPSGSVIHGATDADGGPGDGWRGRGLGLPVVSIPADRAADHFGWIGGFFGADAPASNDLTRVLLAWEPTHQGLLADLDEGHYFRS